MTGALRRADAALGAAMRAGLVLLLVALFVVVAWIVVNRITGLAATGWTDELVEFLFAWLLFLGAASLWRERGHFAVNVLGEAWAGTRRGAALGVAVAALSVAFLVLFVWQSWVFTAEASDASPIFQISKAYWYAAMPACGAIMLAYALRDLVANLSLMRNAPSCPIDRPITGASSTSPGASPS